MYVEYMKNNLSTTRPNLFSIDQKYAFQEHLKYY